MNEIIDLLGYPLEDALALLEKKQLQYILVETKSPFVYNEGDFIERKFVVKQELSEEVCTLYFVNKRCLMGGVEDGL